MEWTDEGIVLGLRRHGENNVIVEVMTRAHGRHLGLVRGGRSKRLAPVLQAGNSVEATWYARLDEHLGTFTIEGVGLRSARFLGNAGALYALSCLSSLLRLLPERDAHEGLYDALHVMIEHLDDLSLCAPLLVKFEVAMLGELGFGLDLAMCGATGGTQDLIYVSPKTGRAICREAGAPYAERLLPLPGFLASARLDGETWGENDLADGFRLTEYFLRRDIYEPRGLDMPEARARFIEQALGRNKG